MYFAHGRKRSDGSEGRSFESYSLYELKNLAAGMSTTGRPCCTPDDGYRGIRIAIAQRLLREKS